jgi:hypothetical protein
MITWKGKRKWGRGLEHLQPLALSTVKFGAKLRRIGRKLDVGSTELPAGIPGRRPEIAVFGLFLQINVQFGEFHTVCQHLAQINVTVRRISYSLTK